MTERKFDCIVIGAGHAGVEAAHAAARMGASTALLTISSKSIARMSCNPAIGGIAKGQIAREVDALGGIMGLATDATSIQFKMLNRSKGPAVHSPRAQADKYRYEQFVGQYLEQVENLTIIEGMASEIIAEDNCVRGVRCVDGSCIAASTVIVTTGTFLGGMMHIGNEQFAGGRIGEPASNELSDSLRRLGLQVERLKTGTPPRLDSATLDYDKLQAECGDEEATPFSFMNDTVDCPRVPCWVTYTNPQIHKLLMDNLHRAPLYSGQIKSTGPRYCPSIEVKVLRFPDRDRHQVFLEPEDSDNTTIYCNGISTSVPRDIQEQMIKLLPGTENARIVHYAYAIEYDYCRPVQLQPSLETRKISGLFLAGQINGTSGYEEAAGQGIIAGINAVQKLRGGEPLILGRDQAYIGVMIDDLLTKGIDEPYRMFTSRAEYRLSLRADNADRRLTPIGKRFGTVDNARWTRYEHKTAAINKLKDILRQTRSNGTSCWDKMRQPQSDFSLTAHLSDISEHKFTMQEIEAAVFDAKYEGYLEKQEKTAAAFKHLEKIKLPAQLCYGDILHLRAEAKQKLGEFTPATLGQASRISGITPADITVLHIHLKKNFRNVTGSW